MGKESAIAIVGTFDSKGEEHLFIKDCIEKRGYSTLTVNIGTKGPSPFPADVDLFPLIRAKLRGKTDDRDKAIGIALRLGRELILRRFKEGEILAVISAGGGTGTHLGTGIMRVLPLGVPKVMVSTVASRNMAKTVGTKDITMIHSVVDLLGVNSISARILDMAAGAVCGMVMVTGSPMATKKRIALTFFGFITPAAETIKHCLEERGYEVIPFHANGTGGMAMEEMAREGYFDAILDLATHELADELKQGYCKGIGPERLEPVPGKVIPRLVVPGGLDCAVLEFTRHNIPDEYKDRKIFFYDFRSAIRLNHEETLFIAHQLAGKLNRDPENVRLLVPTMGWSEADREGGPLYDPEMNTALIEILKKELHPAIHIKEVDLHINDPSFAEVASGMIDDMVALCVVADVLK